MFIVAGVVVSQKFGNGQGSIGFLRGSTGSSTSIYFCPTGAPCYPTTACNAPNIIDPMNRQCEMFDSAKRCCFPPAGTCQSSLNGGCSLAVPCCQTTRTCLVTNIPGPGDAQCKSNPVACAGLGSSCGTFGYPSCCTSPAVCDSVSHTCQNIITCPMGTTCGGSITCGTPPGSACQGVCGATQCCCPPLPKCSNLVDDDSDSLIDLADTGCANASDNDESNASVSTSSSLPNCTFPRTCVSNSPNTNCVPGTSISAAGCSDPPNRCCNQCKLKSDGFCSNDSECCTGPCSTVDFRCGYNTPGGRCSDNNDCQAGYNCTGVAPNKTCTLAPPPPPVTVKQCRKCSFVSSGSPSTTPRCACVTLPNACAGTTARPIAPTGTWMDMSGGFSDLTSCQTDCNGGTRGRTDC